MKLKFDPSLEFQQDAVNAVVGVFDGQAIAESGALTLQPMEAGGLFQNELGVGNHLTLPEDQILSNTKRTQEANHIEKVKELKGHDFSVEMETGTGKTYVYLRTLFELNRTYGFRKFIIVVPSVAIREGVLKGIDMTKEHFRSLYGNVPFEYFVYDSKRLGKVRQFAASNQIQIMVINIQAFVKDISDRAESEMADDELKKLNVINRENDRMSGRKPIEFIQATKPIVIIDEPQSVDNTAKAKRAIARLKPIATLRYSATHREPHNLLYKLDPVKAYDLRLVKRVEVASIRSDGNFNEAYVKLLKTDNSRGIRAQVEIHKEGASGPEAAKVWVRQKDDLFEKSKERMSYEDGYIVQSIDCTPGAEGLEFSSGRHLELGQEIGGFGDETMMAQVQQTVEQHLKKERSLKGQGIKVLSLFFVDKVANYRIYNDDGTVSLGKIGQWFEKAYRDLTAKPRYKGLIPYDVEKVHGGYFSRDNKGRETDTKGNSKSDEDTYNLIMRDKERLLDGNEPLRFIFSHSALREGWDNPNVFQICTLNETKSAHKKRQEIGRGLRLPVNENGERVHDDTVNRLTVIANESYEEFARALQTELEEDFGIRFGKVGSIAFAGLTIADSDGVKASLGQEKSKKLWDELVERGYLDEAGAILDAFNPKNPEFDLKVSDEFAEIKAEIVDEINKKVFSNRVVNTNDRHTLKFHKQVHLSEDFQALWDQIKARTRYRVSFETAELIKESVKRIKQMAKTKPTRMSMARVDMKITGAGISTEEKIEEGFISINAADRYFPDILAFLQKETELTRHTLVEILKKSGRLNEFLTNPQAFMTAVAKEIAHALRDLMLKGIQYNKVDEKYWEMGRIEEDAEAGIVRYLNNLYEVQNKNKSLFDRIEYESEIERKFAHDLDVSESVRLFVKLPNWFKIDTPIGPYNPDWAFVTERDEKLYFVRETKSTQDSDERRGKENQKISCGHRHFEAIGVNFDVVTKLSEVEF